MSRFLFILPDIFIRFCILISDQSEYFLKSFPQMLDFVCYFRKNTIFLRPKKSREGVHTAILRTKINEARALRLPFLRDHLC